MLLRMYKEKSFLFSLYPVHIGNRGRAIWNRTMQKRGLVREEDFTDVFKRPRDVIIGAVAQFTLMPFLAFLLTKVFRLSPELAIGVILVGTCPGGTSSNVMTYLSKGDVAFRFT